MKVYLKYAVLFSCIAVSGSCSGPASETETVVTITSKRHIKNIGWLIGKWYNNSQDGRLEELWEVKNDSTFSGKSFFINSNKDTLSSETISLEQRGNNLLCIPTVKDQNDGKPVNFILSSSTKDKFIFENTEHDFPTKITYTRIGNDSLLAEISGIQNGKERVEQFSMVKAK